MKAILGVQFAMSPYGQTQEVTGIVRSVTSISRKTEDSRQQLNDTCVPRLAFDGSRRTYGKGLALGAYNANILCVGSQRIGTAFPAERLPVLKSMLVDQSIPAAHIALNVNYLWQVMAHVSGVVPACVAIIVLTDVSLGRFLRAGKRNGLTSQHRFV